METELLLKAIKNIIAILPAIISSVSSIYVFSKRPNQSIARERLETVIFPIFECLEKFPNYENTKQFHKAVENARAIIQKNHMLMGVELYTTFYDFYQCKNKQLYRKFYLDMVRETSELFWQCGLPIISVKYRQQHGMLSQKEKFMVRLQSHIFKSSLIFIIGFCITIFILTIW